MTSAPFAKKSFYRQLYIQVLAGVVLGILVGFFWPATGVKMKLLGDGFIKLIKMLIAPIIFCTVVHGLASLGDLKRLGRLGAKTLLYFEVVSTIALVLGLFFVNFLHPGSGFNIDPKTLDPSLTKGYVEKAHTLSMVDFVLNIIPNTLVGAFVTGDLLQVLLISVLAGFGILAMGDRRPQMLGVIDDFSRILFAILAIVVRLAPVGAFGAMAFTIGSYGLGALQRLMALMGSFYLAALVFVVVILGTIARLSGFSIFRFLIYIKDELLLVLGTSSSETALPGMMQKLRRLGCHNATVGLVIPTGYSFNLDGTNIYMAMAAVFLAQATNTPLDVPHQITLLLVAMITSKGASGVTGSGFITLAATLSAIPSVPVESLALLVGIDRFMSECRALTNLVGNGVATVAISRWENEIDAPTLRANLLQPLRQE